MRFNFLNIQIPKTAFKYILLMIVLKSYNEKLYTYIYRHTISLEFQIAISQKLNLI